VNSVTNLGPHIDSELTMLPHIDSVCCTGFFQLRQLQTVRGSLTTECAQTMVLSFISSRLDYCNSLLFGISAERIERLQSIQNVAARLVSANTEI